ncbi:hypothetical protein Pma05_60540 [Plantactinospora mayteni]|uniref:DUF4333 domain-containing protein n=2 Tax=Plantactinospora mayteni TaxID=566021 RepID=A0ABQ4EXT6_9ACTN|nr:hypothetical protein Pma05_60540 [Plantactinospora mayteni]
MTACGGSENTEASSFGGEPAAGPATTAPAPAPEGETVAMPTEPYATPSPAEPSPKRDAPFESKVHYELRSMVAKQAGISIKSDVSCAAKISGSADQKTTCTVSYQGLEVPFEVEVTGGRYVASYRARPQKALLVRAGVHEAFARSVERFADPASLRCAQMPEKALVEIDKETGFTCSYVRKDSSSGRPIERDVVIQDDDIEFA